MLSNDQMKPGRFAKMARGRKLYARMIACWDVGGFVRIGTVTRYSDYRAKHRDLVKLGASGSLYTARGKHWDCIDFCTFRFSE
jgi:hypothetical protein